ncbi:ANTAR domain-containing protein [Cryobacterium lactosi]|uniref:ANTAR domain-containing protein n=1 Tax=Cryobacterium lactosi TaxID=1259202 RepID=A0A4R9BXP6_9MICO|nr:GAF and ANTAR domain-containing protein [Cryobacterium lactosi]TFD92960.1 ANTAR domain-containing protein [Cryobacterium lactosi]
MSMPNDGKVLVEVVSALADTSKPGYEAIDTFDLLVRSATSLTSAVEAGILLADHNQHLHVVASTSERTSDVEEAQLGSEQGPCVVAFRTGETVNVPNIAASRVDWPAFAALAEDRGFHAAHAVPLRHRGQILGGLILFSEQLGPLSDEDAASIEAMVRAATTNLNEELHRALDARVTIERAKGVLAQQYGVPMDAAFSLLRAHARKTDKRLGDIAGKIMNSRGKSR